MQKEKKSKLVAWDQAPHNTSAWTQIEASRFGVQCPDYKVTILPTKGIMNIVKNEKIKIV